MSKFDAEWESLFHLRKTDSNQSKVLMRNTEYLARAHDPNVCFLMDYVYILI